MVAIEQCRLHYKVTLYSSFGFHLAGNLLHNLHPQGWIPLRSEFPRPLLRNARDQWRGGTEHNSFYCPGNAHGALITLMESYTLSNNFADVLISYRGFITFTTQKMADIYGLSTFLGVKLKWILCGIWWTILETLAIVRCNPVIFFFHLTLLTHEKS